MCGSLLADLFPPESRGLANGIFSWGVYWGYGFAFLLGIQVNNKAILISAPTHSTQGTQLDMLGYGWRGPYVLAALPGLLTAALIILTLKVKKMSQIFFKCPKSLAPSAHCRPHHPHPEGAGEASHSCYDQLEQ